MAVFHILDLKDRHKKLSELLHLFNGFWPLHLRTSTMAFPGLVEIVKPVYHL